MKWLLASASLSIFALASCGVVVDDAARDYDAEAEALATAPAKSAAGDPEPITAGATLSASLAKVILMDPDVRSARRASSAASANIGSAKSLLKPQVTGSLLAGGYRDDLSAASTKSGASIDARVTQLLFDGGEARGSISISELEAREAKATANLVANGVASQAAAVWLATWSAQSSLASLKALESDLMPHAKQVQRMANSGMIDRSVSDMIEGRMLEYALSVAEAQYQLDTASYAFKKYFGKLPWLLDYPNPPLSAADLEAKASNAVTPAVRQAALRVLTARAQQDVAAAKYSPRVSVEAGANSPMDRDENPSARIGVSVAYNFYDGGKRAADLDRARESVVAAEHALASARQASRQAVSDLIERRSNSVETIRLQSAKLDVIERQLKVAGSQIQTGQADVAKVFELKVQRHQLGSALRQARADLRVAEYQAASELGLFSPPSENGTGQ